MEGSSLTREGRPPTDILVRERLQQDANDTDALFTLAALHVHAGRLDEGISVLDRVLRLDPRYPGAWIFKSKVHRMRGEGEAAATAWSRGEEMEP